MRGKQKKCIHFLLVILAVLFGCSAAVFGRVQPVFAAEPETVLSLDKKNDVENVAFEASNLFPGDLVTNTYRVKVKLQDTVVVRFCVDIDEGYEKLAEVLKCRIVLKNTDKTLYDGLMKDAPKAMDHTVAKSEGSEEDLLYEIGVYLDTSVGNEYQGQKLAADFVWWVEDAEVPETEAPETETPETEAPEGENPDTGDTSNLTFWGTTLLCSALLIGVMVITKQKGRQSGQRGRKARRKVTASVGGAIILAIGLSVTTYALLYPTVSVEGNFFQTGTVKINLNDDDPVIKAEEFLFEPGMTVIKEFFVENEGTIDVYYRLYFDNVEGEAADVLEITMKDGDQVLYQGKAAELTKENACLSEKVLGVGEKVWLTITFRYPKTEDNDTQRQFMDFDICADAVQTKNNPDKLFE